MSDAFIKIDLHGLTQDEAIRVIDRAIQNAGPMTYQLHLIHGFNRGTRLREMIYDEYKYEPNIKRIIPGDNPGITVFFKVFVCELLYQTASEQRKRNIRSGNTGIPAFGTVSSTGEGMADGKD